MTSEGTLVVLVTAASTSEAATIGRTLVEERLAACVSVVPAVRSLFRWEGRLQEADEALLVVKTRRERYEALEARVRALHSYSVPEVLALPVESGFSGYLTWVRESIHAEGG